MNKLLIVILLVSLSLIPISVAQEEDNTLVFEEGYQFPCDPSEDSLGCAYRALQDIGVLEHPRSLLELRKAFNMTELKVMRFV